MYGQLVLYEKEDAVGIVTLNRPDRLNAMGRAMREELAEVLNEINRDETRVTVFTGSGRAFCAGADIKELDLGEGPAAAPLEGAFVVLRYVAEARKVCIAAVNGIALGAGTELALACDFRIAGDTAQFGLPEVKLGLLPGAGGSQWMPRTVGASRAKWMMMTGDFIDAQTALQWGLVNQVVPAGSVLEETKKLAHRLSDQPAQSLILIKSAVDRGLESSLASALEYEARCSQILRQTEDCAEGVSAFLEKRKPVFNRRSNS